MLALNNIRQFPKVFPHNSLGWRFWRD